MVLVRSQSRRGVLSRVIAGLTFLAAPVLAFAEYGYNFQRPVTPIGQRVLELHHLVGASSRGLG